MARVLVAGCGYVGSVLAAQLADAGHQVWGVRRSAGAIARGVNSVRADLLQPPTLSSLPEALELVYYLVGADARDDASYEAAYVTGLLNLLEHLDSARRTVRRMFFTSSTAVYAQAEGEWVDEGSPTLPGDFTGRRLLEGERLVGESPFGGTVVRLSGIYGPGRTRLVAAVRQGTARFPDRPPVFGNRIHRDDAAGFLAYLMEQSSPEALYVGSDSDPAPMLEVVRWLAGRLEVPEPGAGIGGSGSRRGGSKRCDNARMLASGYRLRFPGFREGYGDLLAGGA